MDDELAACVQLAQMRSVDHRCLDTELPAVDITRKAQLTQRETCNRDACLKAQSPEGEGRPAANY